MARVPIIGIGAICAAGNDAVTGYRVIKKAQDCLKPLSLFESDLRAPPLCGQVQEDLTKLIGVTPENRSIGLALCAVNEALAPVKDRCGLKLGIVLATTVGGMNRSEKFYRKFKTDPGHARHAATELAYHEPGAITGWLANHIGAEGLFTLSTACSTGLHAIGMAKRLIENGMYDMCLAIGVDALSLLTIRGFASLMLIDFTGCKPFDKRRVGISLGEGAAAMLLASSGAAQKLNIRPLATISGWGAGADGHHMTAPHPEGRGAIASTRAALGEAMLEPGEIDMIAAHGTATPDNDVAEIKAMKAIFDPLPPFCSMKRTIGHTLAASGILEAVFSIGALNDNYIPATAGFELMDDAIGVAPCAGIYKPLHNILKNSFGFGGNNASIILSK
jgi:3-oxoacyl-[acyl-carrier-protein] synthase-1